MNRFIKCLAVLFILTYSVYSQTISFFDENSDNYVMLDSTDADPYSFFPMQEGNFWQWAQLDRIILDEKVAKDSLLENGNRLIYISYNGSTPYEPTWLIDTSYNVYLYPPGPNGEGVYYKLNVKYGEIWWVGHADFDSLQGVYKKVAAIYEGEYLGKSTVFKEIHEFTRELIDNEYFDIFRKKEVLASGLGVILRNYDDDWEPPEYVRGAVINGDTLGLLVGVETEMDEKTPNSFTLSQNFPNPFNPATQITYQIPKSSFVTLKVYDTLGKEVATLVNERKEQGRYTVEFNAETATGGLPSGMYIYQITAGKFSASGKMLLMK